MRQPSRYWLLAAVTVLLTSPAFAAFWYEDYEQAQRAMRVEDWTLAVQHLEQAIRQRGESGVGVKTYGMNFINYFPYLQLGIAHYRLGNYDAALAAFDREERNGPIADSTRDLQELEAFRKLAQQARDDAAAAESARLVAASLDLAEQAERDGRLEDAMTEVGKALAIDSENSRANELMSRLQAAVTLQQEERDREQRFDNLLADGKRRLDEKKYGEAATALTQALQLQPDATEAQELLTRARSALAKELEARQTAQQRQTAIADGLGTARRYETSGEYAKAIEAVQSVLALDPENAEANVISGRLLVAQERAESQRAKSESIQGLLDQVDERLGRQDLEGALAVVTRALAVDPTNRPAFEKLQRVQRALRRQLVGVIGESALPPQISIFEDLRKADDEEGSPGVQNIDYANFVLSGAVYSSSELSELSYAVDSTAVELGRDNGNVVELQDGQFLTQWRISRTLPAGSTTFRILATDSNGKSVSREYSVRYVVPFYLARWFYASLLGLVVVGTAGAYGAKVAARQRKLKRRFNPYVAGAPVIRDDQFYGRDKLMTRVLQTIHNNSILLYGERRIGKTSFQHRLKKRLQELRDPDYDFYPVYVDLQGTPQNRFFATLAHDIFEELAPVLDGLGPGEALSNGSDYDYRDLVRDIRAVLQVLGKHSEGKKIKLVLLIDEVDELNAYDPRINQRLRSLFMKNFAEDLVAVVSGVGIKKHWESEGSPWYNFFEEIPVKPFRRQDAVDLIERPIRGVFRLENGVTDRIITLTGGKPYLIQKLCVSLVNRLHDERRRIITLTDVDTLGRQQQE